MLQFLKNIKLEYIFLNVQNAPMGSPTFPLFIGETMGTPTGSRFGHWYWPLVYSAEAFFKPKHCGLHTPVNTQKPFLL